MKRSQSHQFGPTIKKAKQMFNIPTQEEQIQLVQMDILLKNNLLHLQCKELLDDMEKKAEQHVGSKTIIEWLEILKSDLSQVSPQFSCHGRTINFEWMNKQQFRGLKMLSLDGCANSEDFLIDYESPSQIEVVGSSLTKTTTAPYYNIDLLVTLPPSTVESRDILDFRYFNKRSLYLAGIWKTLQICDKRLHRNQRYKHISVAYFKMDERKPILQIVPQFSDSVIIRIIPTLPEKSVKLVQLRNGKNNVRPLKWKQELRTKQEKDLDLALLSPTPFYNMAVLEDIVLPLHHKILGKIANQFPNVTKAILLFKIWATQRDIRFAVDGIDGHQASLIAAYLLQCRRIVPETSPEIIFHGILNFLATNTSSVLNFSSDNEDCEIREFGNIFPFSLVHPIDPSENIADRALRVYYNVFWRTSSSMLSHIKLECQKSISFIQGNISSGQISASPLSGRSMDNLNLFEHLFLERRSFFDVYDLYYHIVLDGDWRSLVNGSDLLDEDSLHKPIYCSFTERIKCIIRRALGNRVTYSNCFIRSNASWKFNDQAENHSLIDCREISSEVKFVISIGLVLDKVNYSRKVDRGPALSEDFVPSLPSKVMQSTKYSIENLSFRQFWLNRSEVRRFKDGSIVESVVWDENQSITARFNEYWVIEEILRYTLFLHLNITDISSLSPLYRLGNHLALQEQLLVDHTSSSTDLIDIPRTKLYLRLMDAFDLLKSTLTSQIRNLPLSIETLLPISPAFRQTSLYPPTPHPLLEYLCVPEKLLHKAFFQNSIKPLLKLNNGRMFSSNLQPLLVLCKFESSSKWPKSSTAIFHCKTAFLLKIKHEVLEQFQIESVIHNNCLDILWKGFIFRIIPFAGIDNERILFSNEKHGSPLQKEFPSINDHILPLTNRKWLIPSLHHNSIKAIQVEYPVYSDVVQLLSFWIASHNLSGHLCHEVLELLAAREFLQPRGFQVPTTPLAGFYRCLQQILMHNWEEEPWILDLDMKEKEITVDVINSVYVRFQANRSFRGAEIERGKSVDDYELNSLTPVMYMVTSNDKINHYFPSFIGRNQVPERVVFNMLINFAKSSVERLNYLLKATDHNLYCLSTRELTHWKVSLRTLYDSISRSDEVMNNCQLIFRFDELFVAKNQPLSTSSAMKFLLPTVSQLEIFRNTPIQDLSLKNSIIRGCEGDLAMQREVVDRLGTYFGSKALIFWNDIVGTCVGVLFRPSFRQRMGFNILQSEFRRFSTDPSEESNNQSFMEPNWDEIILQIIEISQGVLHLDHRNC